jgi:hypothetical protein
VVTRISDEEGMSHPVVLGTDDPKRLSKTIAPVAPKPTEQLQLEKISGFQNKTVNAVLVNYMHLCLGISFVRYYYGITNCNGTPCVALTTLYLLFCIFP